VELTFSGEDVQVVTVGDGEEAIARIPIELPDIVLADIGMPKRSGYDVAAFVKGRHDLSHIPVLLLAGAFEPVDEVRAQQVQCDGVLVKPFEPQQVIARVRDLIEGGRAAVPRPASALPETPEPKTWTPEPRAQSWESRAEGPAAERREPRGEIRAPRAEPPEPPLDDYFERLIAKLDGEPERHAAVPSSGRDQYEGHGVPTLDGLLGGPSGAPSPEARQSAVPVELTDYEPANQRVSPAGGGVAATAERQGHNLVADMFAALFAVEQGGVGVAPIQRPATRPEATVAPVVTDALVDEVTRRVTERLAPDTTSELVRQIVSEIAERLIREEIARIKSAVDSRL